MAEHGNAAGDDFVDLIQAVLVCLGLAVTMIVFASVEDATSTKVLGYTFGGIFLVVSLIFGRGLPAARGRR